jgi:hypothetical protein
VSTILDVRRTNARKHRAFWRKQNAVLEKAAGRPCSLLYLRTGYIGSRHLCTGVRNCLGKHLRKVFGRVVKSCSFHWKRDET